MTMKTRIAILFLVVMFWNCQATSFVSAQDTSYRYLSTDFSIKDANIGKVADRLNRFGITIPFDLAGDATVSMEIQVPVNGLRDTQAYRFDGSISSRRLKVANLELLNAQMNVRYRDGVLTLDPLGFQIPDSEAGGLPPGTFGGTGRLELVPRGELALDLSLVSAPARALGSLFSQPPPVTAGELSGKVKANVPAGDVGNVAAWSINGQFAAGGLKAMERILDLASFEFRLSQGELNIQKLAAKMAGANLSGTAQARLTGDTSYTSRLNLSVSDFAKLVPQATFVKTADPIRASAQLAGTLSPLTFQAAGNADLAATKIGPLQVDSGRLDYSVGPDRFAIQNLSLKLYEGALAGEATLPRTGEDSARLDIQFEPALNLHALAKDASGQELPLFGQIAGKITGQAPRPRVGDIAAWAADLNLSIQKGTAGGLAIQRAGLQLLLQKGVVSLAKTGLTWANSTLDVSGRLALAEPQAFQAQVELNAADLRELNQLTGESQLPATIAGSLEAQGEVKGQWKNFQWQASGSAASKDLTIDKVIVDSTKLEVAATPEQVKLNRFDLALYEGLLKGRGIYPLTPQGAGSFQFDWDKIDVGSVLQAYLNPPTTVKGIMSGQAQANLEKPPQQGQREWSIEAGLQIPAISMGGVEAGDLKGNLSLKDQLWKYQVQGKLFDGDLKIQGELPKDNPPESSTRLLPGQGRVMFSKLQLQKVWQSIAPNSDPRKLSGEVDLLVVWPSNEPKGSEDSGSLVITNLSWNGKLLSDRLEGSLQLDKTRLIADRILGTIAGAEIEAEAIWGLKETESRLLRVQARNLSIPFVAETAALPQDIIQGNCDVEAIIVPDAVWQVDLRLKATQLTVMGVEIQSVSLPLRGTILPSLERGELTLRSGGASFAGGRINGQIVVHWGGRRRLSGKLEFEEVDVKTLVQQSLGSDLPGDGRLSGTVTLEGRQIQNWLDTVAVLDAKLSRCQPRQLPVIEALESVVRTISLSQPVEEGQIKARFAQNALSIQQLTLSGPTLELLITGNVASNRRLNLTLIVKTGRRSIDRRVSHFVGGQLGDRLIGFLADRLIQANIQGTVDRPVVYVKPLSVISVKALQ